MKKITGILFFLILITKSLSQNGLIFLNHITTKDGLPENSVQSIKQDKYGFLWFSSFAGICKYDGYEFIEYIAEPDNPEALYSRSVYNMMLDSFQNLWISFFDTSIYCMYNYETDNFTRFPRSKTPNYIIKGMERKNIIPLVSENAKVYQWIFDNGFLLQKNLKTGQIKHFCIKTSDETSITAEQIKTMFLDSHGVLWIGTENQGVYKVNTLIKPFNNYISRSSFCNLDFKETIRAIYVDNDDIWLGTYNHGIIIFNPTKNKIKWLQETSVNSTNGIINNQVRSILKDKYGYFWIGTKNGLTRFDPKTQKSIHFNRYSSNKLPHNWVHAIMEDHNGDLWIGTFNGIARYDRENNKFIEINYKEILRSNHVCYLYEDSKHNIWVATQGGGLTRLERTDNKDKFISTTFFHEFNNPNSISSNRIFSVVEDKNNNIWVATDYALNIISKDNKIKRIGLNEGLPNEQIMGMLYDDKNFIWISHKKGLSKIDINNFKIKNYTEEDGLQNIEFAENAFFKNKKNGELFFGHTEGINSFFPDSIKDDVSNAEVILTKIYLYNEPIKPCQKIDGHIILDKVLYLTDEIKLKSKLKYFTIEFTSLDYRNIKQIRYKYKLEGFDKKWIELPPGNRKITFSNLPPGKYIFKITSSNSDYTWSNNIKTLKITVLPPWWRTNLAYIIYIFTFLLINYSIYKFIASKARLKSQIWYEKMKARKIEQLNAMKFQFFTNISHELKTPLSLILDPLEKITKGLIKPAEINYYHTLMLRNARRISKLINQLLDFQRIEAKNLSLELTKDDVVNFTKSVFDSFGLIANYRNINYSFKSNVNKLIAEFDSDKIEKILYNLISNAFKYTYDCGIISVELKFIKNNNNIGTLELIVCDNGIGIPEDSLDKIFEPFYQIKLPAGLKNEGTGIGLAHTKELVDILKGNITVKSRVNHGSEFKVTIPIKYDTYELNDNIEIIQYKDANNEVLITDTNNYNPDEDKNITVLIIEDDIDTLSYLKHELSKNYNVITCKNGIEGTRLIYDEMPDIIITDIMMPGIDGLELCKQIKKDERTSHIPIIVITALSGESFQIESYSNGVDMYITKPINTEILKAQINNLIDSRKKLFEYYSKLPLSELKNAANNSENNFINKVIHIIEENLEDPEFNVEKLSEKLKITRRQLSQKIKALTGQTVNEFIVTIKLTKAAEMLINSNYSISEIAFKVGYTVPANFTRSFTKYFGKSPSEYISSSKK